DPVHQRRHWRTPSHRLRHCAHPIFGLYTPTVSQPDSRGRVFHGRDASISRVHSLRRYRSRFTYLVAVGLFAVLSACTTVDEQPSSGSMSEQRGPAGSVPEGLGRYYSQSLSWEDCQPYATTSTARKQFAIDGVQCSRLTVPLDYDKPQG